MTRNPHSVLTPPSGTLAFLTKRPPAFTLASPSPRPVTRALPDTRPASCRNAARARQSLSPRALADGHHGLRLPSLPPSIAAAGVSGRLRPGRGTCSYALAECDASLSLSSPQSGRQGQGHRRRAAPASLPLVPDAADEVPFEGAAGLPGGAPGLLPAGEVGLGRRVDAALDQGDDVQEPVEAPVPPRFNRWRTPPAVEASRGATPAMAASCASRSPRRA